MIHGIAVCCKNHICGLGADPEFVAAFLLMYAFETPQPFRVEMYDVDVDLKGRTSAALDVKRQCDFLGEAEFMLAEMLQDQSTPHTMKLRKGQGNLTVRVEEHKGCRMSLQGTIRCTKISNTGCASAPLPQMLKLRAWCRTVLPMWNAVTSQACRHPSSH